MSTLYCGLGKAEYNRISCSSNAKKIWSRLEVTHEGTVEVRSTRIHMLTQLFDNFKNENGESIDSLFARSADIVNPLNSLGKSITNEE